MKRLSTKRRRAANFGAVAVIAACVVLAVAWGYYMPPPYPREPACAAGEVAMFKDGWWCMQARKPSG